MNVTPAELREASHDVLCVGHASYDLTFSIPHHPSADEKIFADNFQSCGGGPAANAAVIAARLGCSAAFAGYLGDDLYGEKHLQEFVREGVDVRYIARGDSLTPLSAVLVKPDGLRTLVNYKGESRQLREDAIDLSCIRPRSMLFDGHEPLLSLPLAERARRQGIPTLLDAGSLHEGTRALMDRVDYLVASEKFATQWLGRSDPQEALARLNEVAPVVVITLGGRGLVWRKDGETGEVPVFPVTAVDTTGAGDALHGAFAAGLAVNMAWPQLLRYASAAGAICCTKMGARPGLARAAEIHAFLTLNPTKIC
ncbi:MAG: PfkB family carbohydrate kinase [Methylococcaceae bacterium]|nr:PfkB family carbohydrate kinase [Methylococcaceae bacterium]